MKLKYTLRGIGCGIILSVLVMMVTGAYDKKTMSDAEIIQAAKALGMEEATSVKISGLAPTSTPEPTKEVETTENEIASGTSDNTEIPTPENFTTATPIPTDTVTTDGEVTPSDEMITPVVDTTTDPIITPVVETNPTTEVTPSVDVSVDEPTQNEDTVTIIIRRGTFAAEIAQQFYECGLVEDASDFNSYLNENGYANKLHFGTFQIKKGTSYKDIAIMITTLPQY